MTPLRGCPRGVAGQDPVQGNDSGGSARSPDGPGGAPGGTRTHTGPAFKASASANWATGAGCGSGHEAQFTGRLWRGCRACAPATRSRNSSPSRWSISCCRARASKASVSSCASAPRSRAAPRDHQPGRPLHVTGEVGHRQAALPARSRAARLDRRPGSRARGRRGRYAVFGWPVTSSENTRSGTPTCGAASPTQPGDDALRREQVGRQRHDVGVQRVDLHGGRGQHGRRRAQHRRSTRPRGRSRQQAHSTSVSSDPQRHVDAERRAPTAASPALSASTSAVPGQVDLREQHVEVAGQPGRQVRDVAAGLGDQPGDGRRRCRDGRRRAPRAGTSSRAAAGGSSSGISRTETCRCRRRSASAARPRPRPA